MLKPSKHFIKYDAKTYEEKGFTSLHGNVANLSLKPRHWKVYLQVIFEDDKTKEVTPITISVQGKHRASAMGKLVNNAIHNTIANIEDCTACLVTAYIMTEGGL